MEANNYLRATGMEVGQWNQITDIASGQGCSRKWKNHHAPTQVLELLSFSQHVAGWLPRGMWKIFQIDNSSGWIDPVQASLLGGLLFGPDVIADVKLMENNTFLFEFGKSEVTDKNSELLISNLIFTFLLFQSHGYVVSSNSSAGQLLAIQDGVAYLSSRDSDISGAEALLGNFRRDPLTSPQWVVDILAERQAT